MFYTQEGRMGRRNKWVAVAMAGFFILCVSRSSAQDAGVTAESPQGADTAGSGTEMQWAWAEVSSVDPAAQTINVKYLDYETDSEKQMEICFDSATLFENVASASEIKPSDTLSVDYVITADGKNLARTVTVEKTEGILSAEELEKLPHAADETAMDEQRDTGAAPAPLPSAEQVTQP